MSRCRLLYGIRPDLWNAKHVQKINWRERGEVEATRLVPERGIRGTKMTTHELVHGSTEISELWPTWHLNMTLSESLDDRVDRLRIERAALNPSVRKNR